MRPPRPRLRRREVLAWSLALPLVLLVLALAAAANDDDDDDAGETWAVLACTSRFWFNYRHVANALAVYRVLRRLGLPDARIVLMLADDVPCNARNAKAGTVFKALGHDADLCAGGDVEVDYKGNEVTVENFLRVLTGRHPAGTPPSRRIHPGPGSRVLVYMTGHGGDEFLKFHNHEEVGGEDLARALAEMRASGRFRELLFVVDTCQGGTLFRPFRTQPGVLAVGSSAKGENSYAHQNDLQLGVALVDRFTDATADYISGLADRVAPLQGHGQQEQQQPPHQLPRVREYLEQVPLQQLLNSYQPAQLRSHPVVRRDLFLPSRKGQNPKDRQLMPSVAAFFSDAARVRVLPLLKLGGGGREGRRPWEREAEAGAEADKELLRRVFHDQDDDDDDDDDDGDEEVPPAAAAAAAGVNTGPLSWLWAGVGLVGVGLTASSSWDEKEEKDKESNPIQNDDRNRKAQMK